MKKTDNLVHIRFEYDSALKTKKDIISSELDLVRMSKIIERYKELRSEELKTKIIMVRRLKTLQTNLKTLQTLLPATRAKKLVKEVYREHNPEETHNVEIVKEKGATGTPNPVEKQIDPKSEVEDSLEAQLAEIQGRLSSLQA